MASKRASLVVLLLCASGWHGLLASRWAGAGAVNVLTPAERIQKALDALDAGDYLRAERAALRLAQSQEDGAERAWIIAAAACQRQGKYAQAEKAYRQFLSACPSSLQRAYVTEQIRACAVSASPPRRPEPVSKTISDQQRKDLAVVEDEASTESSEHFVVESRNAALAKLVAQQAEVALARIGRIILSGQDYPHSVGIYVWTDQVDYAANAAGDAEGSSGSFSLARGQGGELVRRIDLTQLDKDGRFDTQTLDRVLPHEMCHLVLAEYFGDARCPLAVNEGLAMLAEAGVDNDRVLLAGVVLTGDRKIALDELLTVNRAAGATAAVFYAEAFSLLSYLHERMTPRQFQDTLAGIKGGLPLEEALQRALYLPPDEGFLDRLAKAWAAEAIKQSQYLQALETALKQQGHREGF